MRTGVPFRRLQDWRTLGLVMLFAALAAVLAWAVVSRYFAASGPFVRLAAGGALLAAAYAAMVALAGIDRLRLAAARNPERGL